MAKLRTVIESPTSSNEGSPMPSWMKNFKMPDQPPGLTNTNSGLDSDGDGDGDGDGKEVISPIKLLSPSTKPENRPINIEPPGSTLLALTATAPNRDSKSQTHLNVASKQPITTSSTVPLILPDRLPSTKKILLELETPGNDHDREDLALTDLSGDSGAIGRILLVGDPGARQLQIDLKGVLYNANIVPSPVSMAIVNFSGSNEARIETLIDEYVQLREDARFLEIRKSAVCGFITDDDEVDGAVAHYENNDDNDNGQGKGKGKGKGSAQQKRSHAKVTGIGKHGKDASTKSFLKKTATHRKVTSTTTARGGRGRRRGRGK